MSGQNEQRDLSTFQSFSYFNDDGASEQRENGSGIE